MQVTQDYKITLSKAQHLEVVHALRQQEIEYRKFQKADPKEMYWLEILEKTRSALAVVLAAL